MSDDEAFLRAIHELPADHTRRLIYADYLEEQETGPAHLKAEYLRLDCELDTLYEEMKGSRRKPIHTTMEAALVYVGKRPTASQLRQAELVKRRDYLEHLVDRDWLMWFDSGPVKYCQKLHYKCPKRWDLLALTDSPKVRHCGDCRQNVHFAANANEAIVYATRDECVAITEFEAHIFLEQMMALRNNDTTWTGTYELPKPPQRISLALRGVQNE